MAGSRFVQFVGPSYWLADRKTAVQRSVNCYPMPVEGLGEDAPLVLESTPGLELVADLGAQIRGMRNADGRFFIAAGTTLKEMDAAETITARGATFAGTGTVSMVNGETQLALVNGSQLAVFDLTANTIAAVTSAGWRGSDRVDYLDGYFIFSEPGTNQFYLSAIDDATTLDPLDFSSADRAPDNLVAHLVNNDQIYLLGQRSTEIWINSGGADFPFARYQGTPINVGVVGAWAACVANETLVWVGKTSRGGPYVYTLQGYQPRRISTQAVEQQLERSSDVTEARCWTYQEAGAEFVAVNAPGMETTWLWEVATGQWHERGELVGGAWQPLRVEHVANFNNKHYAAAGTKLYRMSRQYATLAGDALVRERTWPHLVTPSLEPATYRGLEVRCTTGDATPGTLALEISNDGGAVFGAPLLRSLGAEGQRARRVRWNQLGTCPAGGSRVFRLRCSDAVPLTMQAATVEAA